MIDFFIKSVNATKFVLKKRFKNSINFVSGFKANIAKKLNLLIFNPLGISSKYIGGPKNTLQSFKEINAYVDKKISNSLKYCRWEFFKDKIEIKYPNLTIGNPLPGAEVESYVADTTENVYLMPNMRIFSKHFFTLTEDGFLLAPVSNYYGNGKKSHPAFSSVFLPKCKKLMGRSVIVRGGAYWHKLQDGLPALYLAELAGFQFENIDHFIIQDKNIDKNSIFTRAGIPIEKQVRLSEDNDAYECEELIFSSWYDRKGNWYIDYILNQLKPKPIEKKFPKKIYLSRSRVSTRKVLNEDQVVLLLKEYGFECVHNEDLTTDEQIAIFQNASHIISCHGSQLTNIIFCKPGTVVCEIRHINHKIHYRKAFHDLSNGFDLDYYLLYAEKGEDYRDELNNVIETDTHIYIDLDDLENMVNKIGLKKLVN